MSGGYSSKKNMAIGRVMPKMPYSTATMAEANQKRRKTKMTFKQKLREWLYNDDGDVPTAIDRDDGHDLREDQAINFSVIPAAGGRIVQVRTYDHRNDRNTNKLHIITPDENLAESLAQILQIEQLSR